MRWRLIKLFLAGLFLLAWYFASWPIGLAAKPDLGLKLLIDYHVAEVPIIRRSTTPLLGAVNYIVTDDATGEILIAKNEDERIYPASTTKLATALTALNIYPLDEVITVGQKYNEGKTMGLQIGEKLTVKSLVSGLLIFSANDAAMAIAEHHQDGLAGFIGQMNVHNKNYLLKSTNFTNVDGIHSPNHYSSVADLAQLARAAVRNQLVLETVKKQEETLTDVSGKIIHRVATTNELLGEVGEIEGLKTGWTPEAGGCFIGLINLGGHYLISVVAQSPDRFADTVKLVDWARANVSWPERIR